MIAAGFGCRGGCVMGDILGALDRALAIAGKARGDVSALYAPDFKQGERGLAEAAETLGRPLVLLPLAALQAHAGRCSTRSERVMQRFGVPSIAETAACAGAGADSGLNPRLLGPRVVVGAATCALALGM
ncbi:MAG: cobalamin biosynthesis protein [Polyangiales bacterium]